MWGILDVANPDHGDMEWGTTIESFFDRCMEEPARYDFFNLAFDGKFIIDWLMKNGYGHVEKSKHEGGPKPGEFTTMISNMGKWYSFTVKWLNGITTEFRDAAKKFPANMGVAGVAKAYGLDVSKGELDYAKPRPEGYQPDSDELDYLDRDVRIVAKALSVQFAAGLGKLTASSDALNEFYDVVGGKEAFRKTFPLLSDDMDAQIRKAYRGGWTYLSPRFKQCKVSSGTVYDVNSLYPSVMYNELIPYDLPVFKPGKVSTTAERPIAIFSVTFTAKLKADHVACIQIKGTSMFGATEYLTEVNEPTQLTVTSVDWALWNEQYDITVYSWDGGYLFKARAGMFCQYIDKWMQVKAESTGGQREIAKGQLNNLYGKFATNPDITGKIPVLDGELVRYVTGRAETKEPVYTAAGVFITAYARAKTIRVAQLNYDRFIYADTDSGHFTGTAPILGAEIHPTKLGAWKHEYYFSEALFVRPKVYLERMVLSGQMHTAFAGLPREVASSLTFADIVHGKELRGKLHPKSVEGGVILQDVVYTVKL